MRVRNWTEICIKSLGILTFAQGIGPGLLSMLSLPVATANAHNLQSHSCDPNAQVYTAVINRAVEVRLPSDHLFIT